MDHRVIQIVRRFGCVGGMETYVWNLVHGLSASGISSVVVCEQVIGLPDELIQVVKVKPSPQRPRWKAMKSFRVRADRAIRERFSGQPVIIHSHERSLNHQVSTFHGPPITDSVLLPLIPIFGRRLREWLKLEKEELVSTNVQMILPVSNWVRNELIRTFPAVEEKIIEVAWPGVTPRHDLNDCNIERDARSHLSIAFAGKEWKRKGLDKAIQTVEQLRNVGVEATLTVFGPDRTALPRNFNKFPWLVTKGWESSVPWLEFDLLLHPARKEPFGMVISEARAHGIPVLMSSMVGAADLGYSDARVLDFSLSPEEWALQAIQLTSTARYHAEVKWTWDDLVRKHLTMIYPKIEPVILGV